MRSSSLPVALATCLAAVALGGCHAMRFTVSDAKHETIVEERKSYFLWGLTPTQRIDVSSKCAGGVASVKEETTFTDGVLGLLTVGIWQPRTSWYYCLPVQKEASL